MKRFLKLIAAISCGAILMLASAAQAARDLTFFQVSDTHYGKSPVGDKTVPMLVDKMNALPGTPYPAIIGGKVGAPRGVIHTGDITNDGKKEQWLMFVRDYGLTGKDGRLAYPVYETFGNHDGGSSGVVRKGDVTVAKNYLREDEIEELNRLVVMFLDFAEDQARRRKQIFLQNWLARLHDFLNLNERAILPDSGKVSREAAHQLAEQEYERFAARRRAALEAQGEADLLGLLDAEVKKLPQPRKPNPPK